MELFNILNRAAANLQTPTTVSVSSTPVPLPLDNVVLVKGGMTIDLVTATFVVPVDGDYQFNVGLNGDWNNGDDLEITLWKNGTQHPEFLSQNGRGARHQTMMWTGFLDNLVAGDSIQIQLLDFDGGSFDVDVRTCQANCAYVG